MAVTTTVYCSEAIEENRFSAEYFDPKYTFKPQNGSKWIKIGQALKKCQYGISIAMNEDCEGYPILRMNEIDDCFVTKASKYANISSEDFNLLNLQKNDVLFNRTNSLEFVGRTGIVKKKADSVFASYLIRLIPNSEILLPEYLTIYLNTQFGIGQIKRRAMPSINQANVSGSELKRIQILVPDLSVQKKVAELVDKSFAQKELAHSIHDQAQILLEQELGLEKLKSKKSVGYETSFSKIFQSRIIDSKHHDPKYKILEDNLKLQYKTFKLKQIAKVEYGYMPTQDYETDPQKGIPLIRVTNIKDDLEVVNSDLKYIPKSVKIPYKKFVEQDDILMVQCGDTTGKVGYIFDDIKGYLFPSFCLSVKVFDERFNPLFLAALLKTKYMQILFDQTVMINTVRPNTTKPRFENLEIPLFDEQFQSRIANLLIESKQLKYKSKQLLEKAKKMVEDLIEQAAVEP